MSAIHRSVTAEPLFFIERIKPVVNPGAAGPGGDASEPAMLSTETTPRLMQRTADATVEEITSIVGVDLTPSEIVKLCGKMQLTQPV